LKTPILLLALILDQGSKFSVSRWMKLEDSISVVGDLVRLTYIRNPGAVFGLTFGGRPLHLILSLLALALVAGMLRKTPAGEFRAQVGLSMILGGAVGNLIDRIRLGEVIDFIDVGIGGHRWYTFNVADAFVTVGVCVLMMSYAFQRESRVPDPQVQGSDPRS